MDKLGSNSTQNLDLYYCVQIDSFPFDCVVIKSGNTQSGVAEALELYP